MGASNLGMNRVRTGSRGHDEQKLADFSAFLREGNVLALFHCVRPGHYIKSTSDASPASPTEPACLPDGRHLVIAIE